MTMDQSRGQVEAKISEAVINFEREYMGRGPLETKSYIIDDIILVRLKGVLTRAEQQLAANDGCAKYQRCRRTVYHQTGHADSGQPGQHCGAAYRQNKNIHRGQQ